MTEKTVDIINESIYDMNNPKEAMRYFTKSMKVSVKLLILNLQMRMKQLKPKWM